MNINAEYVRALHAAKLIQTPDLILLLLASRRGTGCVVAELAKFMGAKLQTVSMAKKNLLRRGLLIEHGMGRDGRVSKLYLAAEGQQSASTLWTTLRNFAAQEDEIRNQ